ncbi:MAG TPA: macrolide ABC transporter ATP-binding protein, partial [Hyphomicrobium sp.]
MTSAPASPLIEFKRVAKVYGTGEAAVHAMHGIDLKIEAGEFVAIMG